MANEPKPVHVPRAPRPRVVIDDGPLVLVETRKDLSQLKLPFEQQPHAAGGLRPPLGRRLPLGQALQRVLVGRLVHQLVPGQRRGLRQQRQAACLAVRIGLPVAGLGLLLQAGQQFVDGLAAAELWLHSSTRSQPASSASAAASA